MTRRTSFRHGAKQCLPLLPTLESLLIVQDRLDERTLEHLETPRHSRVQRSPPQVDLLVLLRPSLDDLDVIDHGLPLVVVQPERRLVRHPAMDPSASGVDPQQVLEPKVFPERRVEHLDRHGDEPPTPFADRLVGATRPDPIVIRHVDIEHQLAHDGLEGGFGEGLPISGSAGVDGSDLETGWVEPDHLALQVGAGLEGVVAEVGVVGEGERELAVREGARRDCDSVKVISISQSFAMGMTWRAHRGPD